MRQAMKQAAAAACCSVSCSTPPAQHTWWVVSCCPRIASRRQEWHLSSSEPAGAGKPTDACLIMLHASPEAPQPHTHHNLQHCQAYPPSPKMGSSLKPAAQKRHLNASKNHQTDSVSAAAAHRPSSSPPARAQHPPAQRPAGTRGCGRPGGPAQASPPGAQHGMGAPS